MPKPFPATPRADDLVRTVSPELAAAKLGVTVKQVLARRKALELPAFNTGKTLLRWTAKEDRIVLTLNVTQAFRKLPHRSPAAIDQRRMKLRRQARRRKKAPPG